MKLTLCGPKWQLNALYICTDVWLFVYLSLLQGMLSKYPFRFLWWCVRVSRAKRVTPQRPQYVVHGSSMYVDVQLWLLAVIGRCSLTTCPHLVPCPGRRERRSYLPWGMMVRHTQFTSLLTCTWITIWLWLSALHLHIMDFTGPFYFNLSYSEWGLGCTSANGRVTCIKI